MNAHELINYELEFDLTYTPIEEEIIGMLDERDAATDNEHIKEVDNVQIRDVVVNKVGFKNVESALVTSKFFLEPKTSDVTPFI
jgi:hypothetical protein